MRFLQLLSRRHQVGGPDPCRLASIKHRQFQPAIYTWIGHAKPLQFTLQPHGMRVERGRAEMEMQITDHSLDIGAVFDGTAERCTLYLGNHFIVPQVLRRKGLASACLQAMRHCFQIGAFGRAAPRQAVYLQGTFEDEGAAFSRAMCNGVLPTKAAPALVDELRFERAQRCLTVDIPPVELKA